MEILRPNTQFIAGVDEAGRGPLCGPVVAACCHIPTNINQPFIEKIADSKTLNEEQREELYKEITSHPKIFSVKARGMDKSSTSYGTILCMPSI